MVKHRLKRGCWLASRCKGVGWRVRYLNVTMRTIRVYLAWKHRFGRKKVILLCAAGEGSRPQAPQQWRIGGSGKNAPAMACGLAFNW
jgi:hypothetical protein